MDPIPDPSPQPAQRPRRLRSDLAWALVVVALAALLLEWEPVRSLERRGLTFLYRQLGPPRPTPDDLALLLIDSTSLSAMRSFYAAEEGGSPEEPWPWQRLLFAAVVDFLANSGAKAVLLDLDFSQASHHESNFDSASAARVFGQWPVAYLALLLRDAPGVDRLPPGSRLLALELEARERALRSALEVPGAEAYTLQEGEFNSVLAPYAELGAPGTARGLGFVNGLREPDGTLLRTPLFIRFGDSILPSLPLRAALDLLGVSDPEISEGELVLGDARLPLDEEARLLLNWYGPAGAISSHPIHRTIKIALADYERRHPEDSPEEPLYWNHLGWSQQIDESTVEAHRELFRDRVVFIGGSAAELGDLATNPWSEALPGVEAQATTLANLLRAEPLRRPGRGERLAILSLLALLAGVGPRLLRGEWGTLFVLSVASLYFAFALWQFRSFCAWYDLFVPLGTLVLAFGTWTYRRSLDRGRRERQLRATFEHVLQPSLVSHLLDRAEHLELGGELRSMTVLFTDLADSSAHSESLTPGLWVERLNEYLGELGATVISHQAYLDKYTGDGLLAVWGAPVALEDHAAAACRAALEIRSRLAAIRPTWRERYGLEFPTRIGINSGEAIAGMVGTPELTHYTVLGDTVVSASRLEGANKFYGTDILLGEATYRAAAGQILAREVDRVVLKGKSRALSIYEPVALRGEEAPELEQVLEDYAAALARYREGDFAAALGSLESLLERRPEDGPARWLEARCRGLLATPPASDWEGITLLREK